MEVEPATNAVIALPTQAPVGAYPDIEAHLAAMHGVKLRVPLRFVPRLGDTFDQASATWTYYRGGEIVIVIDPPRTVAEFYS